MRFTRSPQARLSGVVLVALALLAAACGGSDLGSDATEPTEPTTPDTQPVERTLPSLDPVDPAELGGEVVTGEAPAELVDRVVADASDRSGAGAEALEVVRSQAVVWSDGSLGCPQPDTVYTQALVEGFHIVVATPDGELDYRTSGSDFFMVCEDGKRPIGG